jgi:hypothetical protein
MTPTRIYLATAERRLQDAECAQMRAERDAARRQHDEHVSKAREWHRRMQQAEAANYQHLKALERAQGVPLSSFARALTYGAMRVAEGERDAARAECDAALDGMRLESAEAARLLLERDMARAECDVLRALLAEARGALLEVRAHMHAAGRRPETCHEMSVIDAALRGE